MHRRALHCILIGYGSPAQSDITCEVRYECEDHAWVGLKSRGQSGSGPFTLQGPNVKVAPNDVLGTRTLSIGDAPPGALYGEPGSSRFRNFIRAWCHTWLLSTQRPLPDLVIEVFFPVRGDLISLSSK